MSVLVKGQWSHRTRAATDLLQAKYREAQSARKPTHAPRATGKQIFGGCVLKGMLANSHFQK